MRRTPSRTAVPREDVDKAIDALFELAQEKGERLRQIPGRLTLTTPAKPDIEAYLKAEFRRSLEEELVPAEVADNGRISESDVDHEIAKKALVGLKIATLKSLARDRGLSTTGVAEQISERVAQAYGWDGAEIARLILAQEEGPSLERGHSSRLFALESTPDVPSIESTLAALSGRYIRVGVARWFLFESTSNDAGVLNIAGSYRAYQASVENLDGTPSLTAVPHSQEVRMQIDGSRILRIQDAGTQAAHAATRALLYACRVQTLEYVPHANAEARGEAGAMHPQSEFILDLLFNRVSAAGFTGRNLSVARFRVGDEAPEPQEEVSGPALRAVRFEGRHLLDSVAACRLTVHERRPLVEVAFQASFRPDASELSQRFPFKISLETDHVLVATGLGSDPLMSERAHRNVLEAAQSEILNGAMDAYALEELANKMKARVQEGIDPPVATMLPD